MRGLLADQFAMAAACLDAFDVTDNVVYEMMAEELGHYAMRTMFDEAGGGLFDRGNEGGEESIGLMSRPLKPFVTNCDAARTLVRLGSASGEQDFVRAADRTIDAMRPLAAAQGPLAAHWRSRFGPPHRGDTLALLVLTAPRAHDWEYASMTTSLATLKNFATQLRIDSVRSTSEAGSGHPTSCLSAAEIMSTLFFAEMCYDPRDPRNPDNDRFVLSKGHAAPILYAAWAEAGLFPREDLLKLRRIDSDLEGHPTPRLSFVDVATGSLGQGICAAIGTALNARRIGSEYRTYVLLGDGEMAEGSVWEAADIAVYHKLDNLCAVIDVNALGQSQHTQFGHNMEAIAGRWQAFEWHTIVVDGHDVQALLNAYAEARATKGRPTISWRGR